MSVEAIGLDPSTWECLLPLHALNMIGAIKAHGRFSWLAVMCSVVLLGLS